MNKFKNVFQRSHKSKATEDRRTQQFVKRHSSSSHVINTLNNQHPSLEQTNETPNITLEELSEIEKEAYQSWWKDLDPFDYQQIDNQTILKFLTGCELPPDRIEDIVALFDSAGEGLNMFQFFAMLRLIAHAQNGRKISPALVYLGAPLPHFNTPTINGLAARNSPSSEEEDDELDTIPNMHYNRRTWWGNSDKQPPIESRRSYLGPFTSHTPIPHSPNKPQLSNNHIHSNTTDPFFYSPPNNYSIHPHDKYSHSRSKSAGTVSDLIQSSEQPPLQSSRSSLSLHEYNSFNTGQSLLLTQKFVYESPSTRNRPLPVNNPFNSTNEVDECISPFEDKLELNSSFDIPSNDESILHLTHNNNHHSNTNHSSHSNKPNNSTHSNRSKIESMPIEFTLINKKVNKHNIPPPPVPPQTSKPEFPKYYTLKRHPNAQMKKDLMNPVFNLLV
ncbi:hypothetical protein BDB01DRAFT_714493 [Pilobolus umbonatus]|nr:hypothetical protein BDB01DRAFT_714493 [Pilobolus umbonatus]